MGWFDDNSDEAQAHAALQTTHKPEITHELLSGAAVFAATKAYEDHVAKNGKPVKNADAKALLAGFAATFIDREVESKGLDFIDKVKAKHEAEKRAATAVDNSGDYE